VCSIHRGACAGTATQRAEPLRSRDQADSVTGTLCRFRELRRQGTEPAVAVARHYSPCATPPSARGSSRCNALGLDVVRGIEPVIPSKSNRKRRLRLDKQTYKLRHRIENDICRLKDFRRIATRYDTLARNFHASIYLAATIVCWIFMSLDLSRRPLDGSAGRRVSLTLERADLAEAESASNAGCARRFEPTPITICQLIRPSREGSTRSATRKGAHRGDATSPRASHDQAATDCAPRRYNTRPTASAVLPRPIHAPPEQKLSC
jgi:hypothetical protein